ncbi:hypothetical protein B0H67DRAFT_590613, partial [Lasiosphaeris hirsuta]
MILASVVSLSCLVGSLKCKAKPAAGRSPHTGSSGTNKDLQPAALPPFEDGVSQKRERGGQRLQDCVTLPIERHTAKTQALRQPRIERGAHRICCFMATMDFTTKPLAPL